MLDFDLGKPDVAALTNRFPTIMQPSPVGRLITLAIFGLLFGFVVFGIWWLGIDFHRAWQGIGRLGQFAVLMFPPSADGQAVLYLKALGETLAIALLGTLLGALFAFPMSEIIYSRLTDGEYTTYQIGKIEAIKQEDSTWSYFMSSNAISNASINEDAIIGLSSKAKDYIEVVKVEITE